MQQNDHGRPAAQAVEKVKAHGAALGGCGWCVGRGEHPGRMQQRR
jgi:hypothetical protein